MPDSRNLQPGPVCFFQMYLRSGIRVLILEIRVPCEAQTHAIAKLGNISSDNIQSMPPVVFTVPDLINILYEDVSEVHLLVVVKAAWNNRAIKQD